MTDRPPDAPRRIRLRFAAELRFLLPAPYRGGDVRRVHDGRSSLGHVVEALGVPLTEVGEFTEAVEPGHGPGSGGVRSQVRTVPRAYVPRAGDALDVHAVRRPQPLPPGTPGPPRFLLDVHLGALARRLRLVGVDTAYRNDSDDDTLLERANAEQRVLLTRDRGLLRRHALRLGAYVRGDGPDDQLRDVLTRFAPPLHPWSRCPSCNGSLVPVPKAEVAHRLEAGTRRTYDAFTRCRDCDRLYWPGAHHARLAATVAAARTAVGSAEHLGGSRDSGGGSGHAE
ncbi:Mut7-C RNAse domain-containing protein [Streptomyces sp. DSM 42041]|uniref:Mut7-C RNAse domain-containing protein n=1 Tax=Streptomyces hazeniae TaxID=3075538 RepID=A0ABU2NSG1_9ACTN|nr:Mut7-C RNAse domain-containing protein [Streptomyces sp. DSM 42041]MDT0379918.1 Mut7-C RNAse domain-containing protein [Streptomyces sp. DSM 42041]